MKLAVGLFIPIALLFGVSGRWNWTAAWAYLFAFVVGIAAASEVFARLQPGLARERADSWKRGKRWDSPIAAVLTTVGPWAVLVVCALDKRFAWSPPVSAGVQFTALMLILAGVALMTWALAVNPFFSAVVRIQADRGHRVISGGPYRLVRHPGYSGMLLHTISTPFLLGTLWGLVPAGLLAAIVVVRTLLEDRTLRNELEGYGIYAARVRWRLVPGVW